MALRSQVPRWMAPPLRGKQWSVQCLSVQGPCVSDVPASRVTSPRCGETKGGTLAGAAALEGRGRLPGQHVLCARPLSSLR
ncbi:unnamed protein product [Staurois parvus]|uniref:Uncharacterized protein n=1 Tax=Staurois parvus TaxID=386267 RepID=A0ABN9BD42_9NEOB|nr:unnamed protein product [Staurois parvus]